MCQLQLRLFGKLWMSAGILSLNNLHNHNKPSHMDPSAYASAYQQHNPLMTSPSAYAIFANIIQYRCCCCCFLYLFQLFPNSFRMPKFYIEKGIRTHFIQFLFSCCYPWNVFVTYSIAQRQSKKKEYQPINQTNLPTLLTKWIQVNRNQLIMNTFYWHSSLTSSSFIWFSLNCKTLHF